MAEHTQKYTYPVKSIVLPKRLHIFLAHQGADPNFDATIIQYHQIIDIFHPNLCLPLNLAMDAVKRIFQIMILPSLCRQQSFNEDSFVFSYIPEKIHLAHEDPYPTESLVLSQNLIKFIGLHDEPELVVDATAEEYYQIIDLFFPSLQLPQSLDHNTLIGLFDILVRPCLRRLEDFDEENGSICYLTASYITPIPDDPPIRVVILPKDLHSFLAFVNIKVTVLPGLTNVQLLQIIDLFHPPEDATCYCNNSFSNVNLMKSFEMMVMPYLRNVISFNPEDNALTYYAVRV